MKEDVSPLVSCVWLFVTPWTIAHKTSLSMEFPRQENCNGLSLPSLGDPLNTGINTSLHIVGQFFNKWAIKYPR